MCTKNFNKVHKNMCTRISNSFSPVFTYFLFSVYFAQIWAKRTQNGPKMFFGFLKNFVISFSWKWSKRKTNFLVDLSTPISYLAKFWFSSYGPKCNQIAGFLKCHISRKKWIMRFIFGIYADKNRNLLQVDSIILSVCNQACPRYPK